MVQFQFWVWTGIPTGNLELDSLVDQGTDVGEEVVGQVGTGCYGSVVEQVGGLPVVNVQGTEQSVIQETVVETDVICGGGLPLQVGVVAVGSDGHDYLTVEHVVTADQVVLICRDGLVYVTYVLLTGLAPAQTSDGVSGRIQPWSSSGSSRP